MITVLPSLPLSSASRNPRWRFGGDGRYRFAGIVSSTSPTENSICVDPTFAIQSAAPQMIPPLPEDLYITVFQYLAIEDVLSVRRVCRSFKGMTSLRGLWASLLRNELWDRNIPTPPVDLDNLNAAQLERYVLKSLHLHRHWTSPSPTARLRRHVTVSTLQARVISVHFITIDGRSCLLVHSLTSRMDPRIHTIECYDLTSISPTCIARRRVQWFGGFAVNSDPMSAGIMAIKTPHIEIIGFDPSANNPDSAFITLITLTPAARSVLAFTGTTIIYRTLNSETKMLDIIRPLYEVKLDHPQSELPPNQPDSFEAVIQEDYAIVLRPKTLEFYALDPLRRGSSPSRGAVSLIPIEVHEFQWRIDSCQMKRQISPRPPRSGDASSMGQINIIIRYSSLFPWPVNLLHHYVLSPNLSYIPPSKNPSDINLITSHNLPYHFPPVLSQTIVSPVRLFAITDIALGPYGSAVWLDSHTEDFFYHGEVGQRLAGRMLTAPEPEDEEDAQDGHGEASVADRNTQAAASMVFGAHEADDWNRVAIDECEGRIAVGSVNGEIVIHEYA